MLKNLKTTVKLQIKAGTANPSPPIGPALGSHGINLNEFCKEFNKESMLIKNIEKGDIISVMVYIYSDKTYKILLKTPPATSLIKKELNLVTGSQKPKKIMVGTIKKESIEKIALIKMPDLTASNKEAAMRTIIGTIRSMGITIL
jgi:large subunit ribosomal protein L11